MYKHFLITFLVALPFLFDMRGTAEHTQVTKDLSPFIGTWRGVWKRTAEPAREGTMEVTLALDAKRKYISISGTVEDPLNGHGTVQGTIEFREVMDHIGSNYALGLVFQFKGAGSMFNGTPRIDARGHLIGPFDLDQGDFRTPTAFDLAPVKR